MTHICVIGSERVKDQSMTVVKDIFVAWISPHQRGIVF